MNSATHNLIAWTLWAIGMAAGFTGIGLVVANIADLARRTHAGWPWQQRGWHAP